MSSSSFKDKVFIVTGASTGIGRATALALAAAGARVVLAARSAEALAQLATELGGAERALAVPTDVSDPDQCQRLIEDALAHFGQLDGLVNNAGMVVSGYFEHLQPGDMAYQFAVNYMGVVYCTQAALPHLKQSRGVIVNVSSVAGLIGTPSAVAYSASKAALNALGRALWAELRPYGVGVVTVCPYFTSGVELGRKAIKRGDSLHGGDKAAARVMPGTQTAEQVAAAIVKAAARRPRLVVLSPIGRLIWRLDRALPGLVDWVMAKGLARRRL